MDGDEFTERNYTPGDGIRKPHEDIGSGRDVYLGEYEFELMEAGAVSVSNAFISEEAFKRLTNQDYYYTINVVSGRRAFQDNILGVGGSQGRIEKLGKVPIEITCDLIGK